MKRERGRERERERETERERKRQRERERKIERRTEKKNGIWKNKKRQERRNIDEMVSERKRKV